MSNNIPDLITAAYAGMMVTREFADWWAKFPIFRGNNSFTEGAIKEDTDKVLYVKEVRESRTICDKEPIDINFTFNKASTPEKFSVITGISYTDYWTDSTGAKGTIVEGGINKDFLKFNFKGVMAWGVSARGCHSKLIIFGR